MLRSNCVSSAKWKKGRLGATLLLQLHGQKLHLLLDKRDKELMVVSPPSLPFLHRLYSCEHTSWRQTPYFDLSGHHTWCCYRIPEVVKLPQNSPSGALAPTRLGKGLWANHRVDANGARAYNHPVEVYSLPPAAS